MDIFEKVRKERGGLANIHLAFSDFPSAVEAHYNYYKEMILPGDLPLKRAQAEALAFLTSKANECAYCIGHHEQAFKFQKVELDPKEMELFEEFAHCLTKEPWKASFFQKKFEEMDFTSSQWLHAVVVVSYFNMANRMAFATNIPLEEGFEATCE